ncbi:hypothetical protein ACFL2H_01910 [Planctomycetota bacterium]
MNTAVADKQINLGGVLYSVSRPHTFGLVIHQPLQVDCDDYLHQLLLGRECRRDFLDLIEQEGLVVCKSVKTSEPTYRRVRGKSSHGKLSQAEYYHHDGCSCPTKPRIVEIRFPHQQIARNVATAIAPFPDVIRAMLGAIPESVRIDPEVVDWQDAFLNLPRRYSGKTIDWSDFPPDESWDQIQGRITRLVRREMSAEEAREYFRRVDELADAYVVPWEMGESRLMLNACDGHLRQTMQHRRAYQKPRKDSDQNGSLVKRWTAEELGARDVR